MSDKPGDATRRVELYFDQEMQRGRRVLGGAIGVEATYGALYQLAVQAGEKPQLRLKYRVGGQAKKVTRGK